MTIARSTPLHGTGHTVGEILDAAAEAGGGGDYTLPVATGSVLGGVKIGRNVSATGDGTLSVGPTIRGTPNNGGFISLNGGGNSAGDGGDVFLSAGDGTANGGSIEITPGNPGSGNVGNIKLVLLPTVDPNVADAVWSDGGVLVQSGHTAPSGGGSPQPGQPTRFLTLTYTHPGNEDGNSVSAATGIPIPDSTIAEGTAWILTVQLACVIDSSTRLWFMSYDQTAFVFRLPGQNVNGTTGPSSDVINVDYSDFGTTSTFTGDPQWDFPSFIVQSGTQALAVKIKGMSTNTPTDWTINVQLTPIAP